MEELTIGEVARQAGLRTSAIRYYESIGLLTPSRLANGHRRYAADVVYFLRFIQVAQWAGFTLDELRTLFHENPATPPAREAWQALIDQKLVQTDQLIVRAYQMKAMLERGQACGCLRLEDCVLVAQLPWEDTT